MPQPLSDPFQAAALEAGATLDRTRLAAGKRAGLVAEAGPATTAAVGIEEMGSGGTRSGGDGCLDES
jgi:hypothetical protein